jgi:hypothetical protein
LISITEHLIDEIVMRKKLQKREAGVIYGVMVAAIKRYNIRFSLHYYYIENAKRLQNNRTCLLFKSHTHS